MKNAKFRLLGVAIKRKLARRGAPHVTCDRMRFFMKSTFPKRFVKATEKSLFLDCNQLLIRQSTQFFSEIHF